MVVEDMDQPNEPLAHKLRNAAIDRTTTDAERVDDFVIDEEGVLDLRVLDRDPTGSSIADPAKALATIRGQLGDAHEIADLYDESEPERPRWRLGRPRRETAAEATPRVAPKLDPTVTVPKPRPPLSRLSMVPLADEPTPAVDQTTEAEVVESADTAAIADTSVLPAGSIAESIDPEIDLRDENRPTADCPKCMGLGRRDLFDRFSQVEFYSCDNCLHMWQQDLS
jgi:hypothetical protein